MKGSKKSSTREAAVGTSADRDVRRARGFLKNGKVQPYSGPEWKRNHPLAQIFDTLSVPKFLERCWNRKVCHFAAKDPRRFSSYFDFETYRDFIVQRPPTLGEPKLSRREILRNIARGDYAQVRNAHQESAHLNRLAKDVQEFTGHFVSIDAFYAPAELVEEPVWHWDPVDKFLFQFEGEGILEIFEPVADIPLRQHRFDPNSPLAQQNLKLLQKIHRRPGDVIYIPRGVAHRHLFSDKHDSLFAPVWLYRSSWHDLVTDLIRQALLRAESDIDFRQDCWPEKNGQPSSAQTKRLLKKLGQYAANQDPAYSFGLLQCDADEGAFVDLQATRNSQHQLRQLRKVAAKSTCRRTSRQFRIRKFADEVEVLVGNKKLYFDVAFAAALKFVHQRNQFTFDDLKSFQLKKENKLELIFKLVENGLITLLPA